MENSKIPFCFYSENFASAVLRVSTPSFWCGRILLKSQYNPQHHAEKLPNHNSIYAITPHVSCWQKMILQQHYPTEFPLSLRELFRRIKTTSSIYQTVFLTKTLLFLFYFLYFTILMIDYCQTECMLHFRKNNRGLTNKNDNWIKNLANWL